MVSASIERAQSGASFPIRHGIFVAIAGPSGAGKDSVMDYARARLGPHAADIVFVRRIITRPMEPGSEVHDTLDFEGFVDAEAEGRFAASWRANGLAYGIPAEADDIVRSGRVVVANVSRGSMDALRGRYHHFLPVIVTAPSAILAERLSARGRESHEEVLARLERAEDRALQVDGAVVIDNCGRLEEAGEKFLQVLRKAAAWSDVCDMV